MMRSTNSPSPTKHDRSDNSLPLDSSSQMTSPFPALKNANEDEEDQIENASSSAEMMKSPITAIKLLTASIQYMEAPITSPNTFPTPPREGGDASIQLILSMSSNNTQQEEDDDEEEGPVGLATLSSDSPGGSQGEEEEDPLFTDLREQSYFSDLRHKSSSLVAAKKSFPPTTTPGDKKPIHHKKEEKPCTLSSSATAPFTSPIITTTTKKKSRQQNDQVVLSLFASPVTCNTIKKRQQKKYGDDLEEQQRDSIEEDEEGVSSLSFNFLSPILPQSAPATCVKKPPTQLETSTLFLSPITGSNLDTTKASNVILYQNCISSRASSSTSTDSSAEEDHDSEIVAQPQQQPNSSTGSKDDEDQHQREEQPESKPASPSHMSVTTLVEELQEEEEEVGYHFVDVDLEASRCDMIIEQCNQPQPMSLLLSPGEAFEGINEAAGGEREQKVIKESYRRRREFLDAMEIEYDIEEGRPLPPPPRSTPTVDPVFEFARDTRDERDNRRIFLVWGSLLLLVGALVSGGVSFFVSGIGEREGEIKFVYKPRNIDNGNSNGDDDDEYYLFSHSNRGNFGGRGDDDTLLLPTRNFTIADDDHFGWDCKDTAYQEYFLRKIVRKVVSNRTTLRTPGSPQHKALEWLINTDGPALCPSYYWDEDHTALIQRYILAVFYFSTGGKNWRRCSAPDYFASEYNVAEANSRCQPLQSYYSQKVDAVDTVMSRTSNTNHSSTSNEKAFAWLTSAPECHWGGVSCNGFGEIVELDIENNNLDGSLPAELQHLQKLRTLRLNIGKISGQIPLELGNLASSLEELSLEFNVLQGPIPATLYQLANLTALDLSNNQLTGSVAREIGNLHRLRQLRLDNNFLTGKLPKTLGGLPSLTAMSMQFNDLTGSVPESLCLGGQVEELTLDCREGRKGHHHAHQNTDEDTDPSFVECPCCTFCY